MIPITLNRHTVKLSLNEVREVQKLHAAKQRGEVIIGRVIEWTESAPNTDSLNRRKDAIQKFNLIRGNHDNL